MVRKNLRTTRRRLFHLVDVYAADLVYQGVRRVDHPQLADAPLDVERAALALEAQERAHVERAPEAVI